MKKTTPSLSTVLTLLLGITFLLLIILTDSFGFLFDRDVTPETTESSVAYARIKEESHLGTFTDPDSGRTMDYHIYIPSGATENMPLVVYLHGTGAIGNSVFNENNPAIAKALEAYGDGFPFILLAPSSMFTSSWRLKHIPFLVKALIDDTADKYNVDRSKIIIIGHSMGAGGVMRQIELYGNYYSAAVPVSLTSTEHIDITKCLDVPIWGFAGTEEAPHEYNMQKLFDKINESGGNAVLSVLEGVEHGDSADYAFTREVFEWAIGQ